MIPEPWSEAVRAARERWPGIALDDAAYFRHLAALTERASQQLETLEPARLVDLCLCVACARGDAVAIRAFEATYFPELSVILKKLGAPAGAADDLRQLTRYHLFVPSAGAARILAYAGTGSLRTWVRVVMTRLAINALSRNKPDTPTEDDVLSAMIGGEEKDPELAYIKDLYRDEFRAAFREAFDQMSEDDRRLVRCAFEARLSIDAIAVLYDIHRSTAARRVLKVRNDLVANVRAALKIRLHVSSDECDSLLRFMRSQLDIDL